MLVLFLNLICFSCIKGVFGLNIAHTTISDNTDFRCDESCLIYTTFSVWVCRLNLFDIIDSIEGFSYLFCQDSYLCLDVV
jgi:hypothetical protein